jgi:dihydroneopterin aldolase/2-amino-4-hydroxy-6-hydroxymethyldihydropteridine diphosphokinase/dihydropteroate synthase
LPSLKRTRLSIIPDFIHPILNVSIKSLLDTLLLAHPPSQPTHKLISFSAPNNTPPDTEATIYTLQTCTYLMATLNITPDSFSDGNQHNTVSAALEYVRNATQAGADIIDIGGYSTRPGAKVVSPQEELRRIAPVIKAIRDDGITLPISVDTFRFEVAHEAILLGANCINDVHALADEGMLDLARHHAVPVIMMHSRGDAGKNKDYSPVGVIESIRTELGERVRVALEAGIRRWNLFVDPGIGFSKNVQDNVKMLRDLKKLTEPKPKSEGDARNSKQAQSQRDLREITLSYVKDAASGLNNLPTLVGTSRKSFLGHLIGRPLGDPKERGWATAAAVSAAVQQHVDFLRVHDVSEMVDVVMVADALWR